eukprot:scaffold285769_cov26-Tisochrysis_lutea.AAC.1
MQREQTPRESNKDALGGRRERDECLAVLSPLAVSPLPLAVLKPSAGWSSSPYSKGRLRRPRSEMWASSRSCQMQRSGLEAPAGARPWLIIGSGDSPPPPGARRPLFIMDSSIRTTSKRPRSSQMQRSGTGAPGEPNAGVCPWLIMGAARSEARRRR